ncbi:Rho GTPase-activating protein [Entamoeba histolytica HM-3:IMSS]|uniref:RhoGAP domain containing protein n=5 Tax=Entamoeba histolytica TaxID=5759 RepID=C4LUJ9_ENTH1|nr:RhoGAP domain containing protein [Entamoeba histolytica HM-1:IMSS]EAL48094.1 RhoGAP domain containing protein [Entamoeba histolytica HM-1:IMSS]EMD44377.1 rho GTPase-activating protein, putative [Entamoeba histolytica KU27]EMS11210.1 Rho GTPase-activating protein [Entamoeba histolytica HM-3:IMSS]GAT92296.1 rhogap domain containing protein [Entamoeba histolytica]|eukprot:XP_653480.1 RhoGAP domain containing protein [Entamoeba histolytica HM-1:IMSS]
MTTTETTSFKEEFNELIQLEEEMKENGKKFEKYYSIFTPEVIKKTKISKEELNEMFPSNLETIKSIHLSLSESLYSIKKMYEEYFQGNEERKEVISDIIIKVVMLYDENLDNILVNYTSVYHKLCIALYASEHFFPKLPKKIKINKEYTLAMVYIKYIEYVSNLFKTFVGIVQHLSGNDPNWNKSYDIVYGLQIIDSSLKAIYSTYPNIIKIMNLRKHFKCSDYFPTDRMLLHEDQVILKSLKIEVISDEELNQQWVQQCFDELNIPIYCFLFEDTILLISSDQKQHQPLQYWLNDCQIEELPENECQIFDQSDVKKETTILLFNDLTQKKEWIDIVTSTQIQCKCKRLFGKSLETYMKENEPDESLLIPQAIDQCFFVLDEEGVKDPFVFKRKGDGKIINKIIPLINLGKDFEIPNALIAADIIKIYLRNLPEPLLPYDSIPELIEETPEKNIVLIIQYIDKLPLYNKALLNRLMKLCYRISLNHEDTQMDSLTLAKILAPNLCWSKNEGITGNIYTMVEMLIAEYPSIFEMIDKTLEERQTAIFVANNNDEKEYFEVKEKLRQELVNEENGEPELINDKNESSYDSENETN